jgi:uncharacterized membrane protein YfcA
MLTPIGALFLALALVAAAFLGAWWALARRDPRGAGRKPAPRLLGIGFVTDFLDTLGIGSFATTTSLFRLFRLVPDEQIPGTLNVGHALPTVAQAFIYIAIIRVDVATLLSMIAAAVLGSWLGAGLVSRWNRRRIQAGMGLCLLGAAALMLMKQFEVMPAGGTALSLEGGKLALGLAGNFALGALMAVGIGLYAPCMILVSLLGMSPETAFPIMMGSCAFLMPISGLRFVRERSYHMGAAVALAIGGVPAVLIAAKLVWSLPIDRVRWLVIVVVLYTSAMMLTSAARAARAPQPGAPGA